MTLGKDIADKIKSKSEKVEWNKVLEEINWEAVANEYGPNVEYMLNYLREAYPGWYFENMTVKGLALTLSDRGFFVTEQTKYFVYKR